MLKDRESTKVILINENGTYSVEVPYTAMTPSSIMDYAVIPVLLAAGYSETTLRMLFESKGECQG